MAGKLERDESSIDLSILRNGMERIEYSYSLEK